jgi:glucose/arabinose dehydrogenase/PKD repeat protein
MSAHVLSITLSVVLVLAMGASGAVGSYHESPGADTSPAVAGDTGDSVWSDRAPGEHDRSVGDFDPSASTRDRGPVPDDARAREQIASASTTQEIQEDVSWLNAPEGFRVTEFSTADELGGRDTFTAGPTPGARILRFHNDTLYVSVPTFGAGTDRILALPDDDGDGEADRVVTVLESPEISDAHGFDFADDHLYLVNHGPHSEQNNIVRYRMSGLSVDTSSRTVLNDSLPSRGEYWHWTRTLEVRDDHLYVAAGSESNVDESSGGWYARMTRCDVDGSDCTSYAEGLRNAVGFTFHDGELFATDNARDDLSDELPPDEINVVRQGAHYGWPYCYGDNVADPAFDDPSKCTDKATPAVNLRAHTVPLGLEFYTADAFPSEYRGDLYVAMHGSYSANPPRGYKVVRVPYDDGTLGTPEDFVTGWYDSDGDGDPYEKGEDILGRPVDVAVGPDGAMYVSDDSGGAIYRIAPTNTAPRANVSWSPERPETNETVAFDASNSTDPDGSIASYEWDFDGDGAADATGETANWTFPTSGERTVTLTVTDDGGATDAQQVTLTVEEPPAPANFRIGNVTAPDSVTRGDLIDVSAEITNVGDREATQTVEFRLDADGNGTLEPNESLDSTTVRLGGTESTTVAFVGIETSELAPGEYTHGVVTANETATATVAVEAPNRPPTADAGENRTVEEGDSVSLDGSGSSDPDGDTLAYAWTQTAGPTASVADETSATPTVTAPEVDANRTLVFELSVSDGNGGTDTDAVTVEVLDDPDPPDPAPPATTVTLSPEQSEVLIDENATYDVVVDSVDGGVGAYNLSVSVENESVATVADAGVSGTPSRTDVSYGADGSTVRIEATGADTADTGSVAVASVVVSGSTAGTSDLTVAARSIETENGTGYNVTEERGASVTVSALDPIGEFENPPTDPDGDGLYEDVNGNSQFNIVDVQALFVNRDDPVIRNNPKKFDFNENGRVNVVDVQKLFNEVIN